MENIADKKMAELLTWGKEAALAAGEIIKTNYNQPHDIIHKGAIDIVTETDIASEKTILRILKHKTPEALFLAEESSRNNPCILDGPLWIIDPLDGTTNFAHGFPYFGISIAYAENGIILAGLIYCPLQNELFYAAKNNGAWLNNNKISVTDTDILNDALIATGFPYELKTNLDKVIRTIEGVLPKVRDLRRAGAAALDLAYLACGRLDGFWEMDLQPWDTAAGQIILEEAGGRLTNFKGGKFSAFRPEIIASNSHLHDDLVNLIAPILG